jgi:predicted aspartyl protease
MLRAVVLICYLLSTSALAQIPGSSLSDKLDADVAALRYDDLVRDLPQATGGEYDLFAGVLADRTSRFDDAIRLLTPLASATDLSPSRMALVLGSLADANVKLFRYAQASALYTRLLTTDAAGLPPNLLKDDQDDSDALKLLLDAPPQTITIDDPIDLTTHSDPLGSITADLTVHGITAPWILDTGASFSVISETFAHQLGLTFSTGTAHSLGATGVENPIHVAVIDTLPIGSATLHNVVVLIFPDANLTIQFGKKKHYTIPAALGYPVYQSLGIIRFTHDHRFQAGPTLPLTGNASPIYMEKLSVLFSCRTHNLQRTFLFDSGANVTTFFIPYYRDFPTDFLHEKQGTLRGSGIGGVSNHPAYLLENTGLQLAGRDVDLQHIAVLKTPQNGLFDDYEGNLGRDLISAYDSITLDLTHDRVYLGPPVN